MAKKGRAKPAKTYSSGRVKRGPAPLAKLTRTKYRKALPELRRDFEDRCAYCMRLLSTKTEMHVDHFDPRRKNDKVQVYSNLFLADARCNEAKSDDWPSEEERAAGCRFLNCCDEIDYGKVIFEDPSTHLLVGTTPAARYHIEKIDLNSPDLVAMRKRRFEHWKKLNDAEKEKGKDPKFDKLLSEAVSMLDEGIPLIEPPQGTWFIQ